MEEFVSQIADMRSEITSLQKTNELLLEESATRPSDLHKVSLLTSQGHTKVIFI